MGKSQHKGNKAANKYRRRIRHGRSMIVKVPWGKEMIIPEGYSLLHPPPLWKYWENQWGRGFYFMEDIRTPYDMGLSEEDKKRLFPDWYKRYHGRESTSPSPNNNGKKGT